MKIKTILFAAATALTSLTAGANPALRVANLYSEVGVMNGTNGEVKAKFVFQEGSFWCKSEKTVKLVLEGTHMNAEVGLFAKEKINTTGCTYRVDTLDLNHDTRIWDVDATGEEYVVRGSQTPIKVKFTGLEGDRTQVIRLSADRSLYTVHGAPTTGSPVNLVFQSL